MRTTSPLELLKAAILLSGRSERQVALAMEWPPALLNSALKGIKNFPQGKMLSLLHVLGLTGELKPFADSPWMASCDQRDLDAALMVLGHMFGEGAEILQLRPEKGDKPSISFLNLLETDVFLFRKQDLGQSVILRVARAPDFTDEELPAVELPVLETAVPSANSFGILPVAQAVYGRLVRSEAAVETPEIDDLFAAAGAAAQPSWEDVIEEVRRLEREGASPASVMNTLRSFWRG